MAKHGPPPRLVTKEFIKANCIIDPNGCWNWNGVPTSRGYCQIRKDGRQQLVHRVSFELWNRPIPAGMLVCHDCDNPRCCNPEHLFIGTNKDNVLDAVGKGRWPSGVGIPVAKLSQDQLAEIKASKLSTRNLARNFNVHHTTIWRAKAGRSYLESQ